MRAAGFAMWFYLGLGAPAQWARYPEGAVRAARGCTPGLVLALLHLYLGEGDPEADAVERVNFRSARITMQESGERFFFKEFPRRHRGHDLERVLRISRVDRAWRAAYLLPRLGLNTPAAIGTVRRRDPTGAITEYLATRWLEGGVPFPRALPAEGEQRADMLREFAALLRLCHTRGVYSRDFVKNVLVVGESGERAYWLADLDGLHPLRRINRRRILFHLGQLAHYCPLSGPEVNTVCDAYLGTHEGAWAEALKRALG